MKIKLGRYYVVDARYVNAPGFLAPNHGVRYHLSEHSGGTLCTTKELFNKQHFQAYMQRNRQDIWCFKNSI